MAEDPAWLQAPVGKQSACRRPAPRQAPKSPAASGDPAGGVSSEASEPEDHEPLSRLPQASSPLEVLELFDELAHLPNALDAAVATLTCHLVDEEDLDPVVAHPGWARLLQGVHLRARAADAGTTAIADCVWDLCELAPEQLSQHHAAVLCDVLLAALSRLGSFTSQDLGKVVYGLHGLAANPAIQSEPAMPPGFLDAVEQQLPRLLPEAQELETCLFVGCLLSLGHEPSQHVMTLAANALLLWGSRRTQTSSAASRRPLPHWSSRRPLRGWLQCRRSRASMLSSAGWRGQAVVKANGDSQALRVQADIMSQAVCFALCLTVVAMPG